MSNIDLSILIPARNEEWLGLTVKDLLENIEANTEIIIILDGYTTPIPSIPRDPRVLIVRHVEAVGQRAATNEAARLARGKYLMKVDAHCAFDKGFDRKMLEAYKQVGDDVTMAPMMKNLHVFDWVCPEGHRRYQSPSGPCETCKKPTIKEVVWISKKSPNSASFCFDSEPHFQYFGEYSKRPEAQIDPSETMSLQGSCFMCTKKKYFELGLCGEDFPSWGSQGIEVACKTWLSGGRVMVLKSTWYSHCFRTRGGDFGFPYPQSGTAVSRAKHHARDLFFNNKWDKQVRPLSWLLKRFYPIKGWTDEELKSVEENDSKLNSIPPDQTLEIPVAETNAIGPTKGIIYYTDSQLDEKVAKPVRDQLQKISDEKNIPIVSASLKKLNFGKNIHFPSAKRGYLTMFRQILSALEHSTADIIFFCEHDVFYSPTHFDTVPEKDTFHYNQNVWFLRMTDGHALHFDVNQLSGLSVYREVAITHFKERIRMVEKDGYHNEMGFEPMTHNRIKWENQFKASSWMSAEPNIDIKHGANATGQRWKKEEYRNQQLLVNWTEGDEIPSWGKGVDLIKKFQ